jgi:hypothetical protein
MIDPACGFFTSSPNHYAACGWKVADGYWSKRRREARAEQAALVTVAKLLNQAVRDRGEAPHRRHVKPHAVWIAGRVATWYVRGALARHVDGDNATSVQVMTTRILSLRESYGYRNEDAIAMALAYADGLIHSPDPTPPPTPHPYGKDR